MAWPHTQHTTILRLSGFCPGLPGWAGTRGNIHPLTTILIVNHPSSAFTIYCDPWHPPCSICAWHFFSTNSVQVFFGLPLGLAPSTSYSIHFFTQSFFSLCMCVCVFVPTCTFVIVCWQCAGVFSVPPCTSMTVWLTVCWCVFCVTVYIMCGWQCAGMCCDWRLWTSHLLHIKWSASMPCDCSLVTCVTTALFCCTSHGCDVPSRRPCLVCYWHVI